MMYDYYCYATIDEFFFDVNYRDKSIILNFTTKYIIYLKQKTYLR
jgi:hypothetical protein